MTYQKFLHSDRVPLSYLTLKSGPSVSQFRMSMTGDDASRANRCYVVAHCGMVWYGRIWYGMVW